jgi:hypothetical protein
MACQTDIKSTEQYKHEVLGTPGTLQVLECYNDWAGPSKPIQATLKALYFSLSDRPLKFYTVRASLLFAEAAQLTSTAAGSGSSLTTAHPWIACDCTLSMCTCICHSVFGACTPDAAS